MFRLHVKSYCSNQTDCSMSPHSPTQDLVRATVLLAVQHSEDELSRSEGEGGMTGSSTMDVYNEEDERVSAAEGDQHK